MSSLIYCHFFGSKKVTKKLFDCVNALRLSALLERNAAEAVLFNKPSAASNEVDWRWDDMLM
jgi:hypothetical protein